MNGTHGVSRGGIHGKDSMIFMSKGSDLTDRIENAGAGLVMSGMYQGNVRILSQSLLHFF